MKNEVDEDEVMDEECMKEFWEERDRKMRCKIESCVEFFADSLKEDGYGIDTDNIIIEGNVVKISFTSNTDKKTRTIYRKQIEENLCGNFGDYKVKIIKKAKS